MTSNKLSRYFWIAPVFLLSLLMQSCFEDDERIILPGPGESDTLSIVLGENYHTQAFYNLANNSLVAENNIADWDLAFDCSDTSWYVYLNSAKKMLAATPKDTSFTNVVSDSGLDMVFDQSNGIPDSTAFGKWWEGSGDSAVSLNYVFVIDRGYNAELNPLGKKKISLKIEDGKYKLRYANMDGSDEGWISFEKNNEFGLVYFSFDNGLVSIAPKKEAWSLKFSKYTTMLSSSGQPYPYVVTGVLLNPNHMKVAEDSTSAYEEIELADTLYQSFTHYFDGIGWDWKTYSFDSEMYTVHNERNYIIKNYDGYFYKLRFLSFYSPTGVKGTVKFEVMRL